MTRQWGAAVLAAVGIAASVPALTATPAVAASSPPAPVYAAVLDHSDGSSELVAGRLGGRPHHLITGESIGSPAVAPHGHRIAFIEQEGNDPARLAVIGYDGTGHRFLTTSGDPDATAPAWSPDGTTIYFALCPGGDCSKTHVYAVPADGSARPVRIPNTGGLTPVAVRPNGHWLACHLTVKGEITGETVVIGVHGRYRHRVGRANMSDAAWRPRHDVIAVEKLTGFGIDTASAHVALVDLSTGRVTAVPGTDAGVASPLAWGPKGARLYYAQFSGRAPSPPPHIYRVAPDGTHRIDVTPSLGSDWEGDIALQHP